jgi:hypothetical protein
MAKKTADKKVVVEEKVVEEKKLTPTKDAQGRTWLVDEDGVRIKKVG